MRRICFLVDGFNLYHSIKDLERETGDSLHWLDISALCGSYLGAIDPSSRGYTVFYFSALAHHTSRRSPGGVDRHKKLIAALESTGVVPIMGSFKEKDSSCPRYRDDGAHCAFADGTACDGRFKRHEEKQTDVAIASKLVELAVVDSNCSAAVILGGDSDLLPAISTAKRIRPELVVVAAFPYRRYSNEVKQAVDKVIRIRPEQYKKFQLPKSVVTPGGATVERPAAW